MMGTVFCLRHQQQLSMTAAAYRLLQFWHRINNLRTRSTGERGPWRFRSAGELGSGEVGTVMSLWLRLVGAL